MSWMCAKIKPQRMVITVLYVVDKLDYPILDN